MKKIISLVLTICIVLGMFAGMNLSVFAVEESETYHDVEYTMYQAYRYSQDFMPTFGGAESSYANTYFTSMSQDAGIVASISAWELAHLAIEPTHTFESGWISKKDMYKLAIFDMLDATKNSKGFSEGALNERDKYRYEVSKLFSDIIDVDIENLQALEVTDDWIDVITSSSDFSKIISGVEIIESILNGVSNFAEAVDDFASYKAVSNMKNGVEQILTDISNDTQNPYDLRVAARECIAYFNSGYDQILDKIVYYTSAFDESVFLTASNIAFDWAWGMIANAVTGGIGIAIFAGAKGMHVLSNALLKLDERNELYYNLEANVILENAIRRLMVNANYDYLQTKNYSEAVAYVQAVDMYKRIVLQGFDYSVKLLELQASAPITQMFDWLTKSYTKCIETIEYLEDAKIEKQNLYSKFEKIINDQYIAQYLSDYNSVMDSLNNQVTVYAESVTLSQIKDINIGDSGDIDDYIAKTLTPQNSVIKGVPYFTSSDESIIKIDSLGFFEAVGSGECTLTYDAYGSLKTSITITVGSEPTVDEEYDYLADFKYTISNGEVTITDYTGSATELIIPAVIEGYPVTSIGREAFRNCTRLTSIIIPDSVASIRGLAFYDCYKLTSITIPDSVASIATSAFLYTGYYNNASNWENDVLYIGNHLIDTRLYLSGNYIIKDGTKSIADSAFYNCDNLISITIPNTVISIGNSAFSSCDSLASITIPNSVTFIGENAFACDNLTSIIILDGVTSIGELAFRLCTGLTNITIPKSVTYIGYRAFEGCNGLSDVWYTGNETEKQAILIMDDDTCLTNAVWHYNTCSPLEHSYSDACDIDCNKCGYKRIAPEHIYDNDCDTSCNECGEVRTTSHTYGDSCDTDCDVCGAERIVSHSYSEWFTTQNPTCTESGSKHKECTICADTVTESIKATGHDYTSIVTSPTCTAQGFTKHICDYCADNYIDSYVPAKDHVYDNDADTDCNICDQFRDVGNITGECTWSLDGTVLTISGDGKMGDYSYPGSAPWGTEITKVIILDGVTSIGAYAFYDCDSLTSIKIPYSVTTIGDYAFDNCDFLVNAMIPYGVTNIGKGAFGRCYRLLNITIPDSVISIGEEAFSGCHNFTSITIPHSVTTIGVGAFGMSGLLEINVDANNQYYSSIDGVLFDKNATKLIQYPRSRTNSVYVVPKSVTCIGEEAFNNNIDLVNVEMSDGVTSIGEYAFNSCYSLETVVIPSSITSIKNHAFGSCSALTDVLYTGNEVQQTSITIGNNNYCLTGATWHYNICENDRHVYDNQLDLGCNNCEYQRPMSDIIASFEINDITLTEGVDSIHMGTYDSESNSFIDWFRYNCTPNATLVLKDGTVLKSENGYITYNGQQTKINYYDGQNHNNQWTQGVYNIEAEIFGLKDTFTVTIKENPIERIIIDDMTIVDGFCDTSITSQYDPYTHQYTEWKKYNCRPAFTVILKDGTVLKSNVNGYVNYNGALRPINIALNSQSICNQWSIGNTYTVEGYFLGVGDTFTVTINENPIASVEIDDVQITEGERVGAFQQYNSTSGKYDIFYKYCLYPTFRLRLKDGTVLNSDDTGYITYNGNRISLYNSVVNAQSYDNPWGIGTHTITTDVFGVTSTFTVTITESPVESVELVSGNAYVYEYANGQISTRYDYNLGKNVEYFYYSPYSATILNDDCKVKISYKDGRVETLSLYEINRSDIEFTILNTQHFSPWALGNHNTVTISIMGKRIEIPLHVIENPIESVVVNNPPTHVDYVYGDMKYGTFLNEQYVLFADNLEGMSITVYYKNGTQGTYVGEDEIIDAFYAYSPYSISTIYCDSVDGTYTVTINWMGHKISYDVNIKKSPVESIEIVKMPTDTHFVKGYAPDFNGTEIKINYTDGTSKIVTLNYENALSFASNHVSYEIDGHYLCIRDFYDTDVANVYYLGAKCSIDSLTKVEGKAIADIALENITHNGVGMILNITYADSTTEKIIIDNTFAEYTSGEWLGYYAKTQNGIINYAFCPILDENENVVGYTVEILNPYNNTIKSFTIDKSEMGCVYDNDDDIICNICGALRENAHIWSEWAEQPDGTYYRECADCGATETLTIPEDKPINTTPADNAADTNLDNSDIELLEKVLNDQEQSDVANGAELNVYLVVNDITESVTVEDKTKVETTVPDSEVGMYLDIDLYKKIDTNETQVTETDGNLTITITVPDELINTDSTIKRKYQIVRVHNGISEVIDGIFNPEDNTFTFETDKFSTYALIYTDKQSSISGDVNRDGNINSRDCALIMQSINGWDVTIDLNAADVNGDGKLNSRDYVLLVRFINGWNVELV